mmetsp:Transcript_47509/g.107797  ORF Transcript_47509/g.107797 Transcript_47509/m.107797 type:complete len:211 (-) Transcript_47509:809-1441(-)
MDARETAVETSALAHGPWLEPCDETLAATLRIDCRGRAGAPAGARVSNLRVSTSRSLPSSSHRATTAEKVRSSGCTPARWAAFTSVRAPSVLAATATLWSWVAMVVVSGSWILLRATILKMRVDRGISPLRKQPWRTACIAGAPKWVRASDRMETRRSKASITRPNWTYPRIKIAWVMGEGVMPPLCKSSKTLANRSGLSAFTHPSNKEL